MFQRAEGLRRRGHGTYENYVDEGCAELRMQQAQTAMSPYSSVRGMTKKNFNKVKQYKQKGWVIVPIVPYAFLISLLGLKAIEITVSITTRIFVEGVECLRRSEFR